MRHPFGGGLAGWAMAPGASSYAYVAPGAEIRAYNAPTGGLRITDLSMDSAGVNVVGAITSGPNGQIPVFYGPDGITELWLSANNGPRVKAPVSDGGAVLDAAAATLTAATGTLTDLEATEGQPGGIATLDATGHVLPANMPSYSLSESDDVNVDQAANGNFLVAQGGGQVWVASSPTSNAYPTPWNILGLVSGYSPGSRIPAYRFLNPHTVQYRGSIIKNSAPWTYGAVPANIPDAAVPAVSWYLPCHSDSSRSSVGFLDNGQLTVYPQNETGDEIWLDGCIYDAAYGDAGEPRTLTRLWDATWSESFFYPSDVRGGNLCAQGKWSSSTGNQWSVFGFDNSSIQNELAGATINSVTLSMFIHTYNSSGTAQIGTHNFTGTGNVWDADRINERRWSSSGWADRTWRNISMPTSLGVEFQNGTTTGFSLGPGSTTSTTYCVYVNGAYGSAKPYLTIIYTK
jgi:hypothetical protein